jgi:adenylate cyclase
VYESEQQRAVGFAYGPDRAGTALAWLSLLLWLLGYPDRAVKRGRQALAVAQEQGHFETLAGAMHYSGAWVHLFRRELPTAAEWLARLARVSAEEGHRLWQMIAALQRDYLGVEAGEVEEEDVARMVRRAAEYWSLTYRTGDPCIRASLAKAYGKVGRPGEGLKLLAEALEDGGRTGDRWYEAEVYRIQADLLQMQGDEVAAEASFREAIDVARQQQARSWELRATMSLCRLWQKQGKREEAHEELAEIYGWFTEGFDTGDLIEARALLEQLSGDGAEGGAQ